ncbi:MAG: ANTAR domain-containing protein [Firmicutes bacterium]|nr:ANTAR domain-containing protein [Bacillota bacterium]
MSLKERIYSILIVSAAENFNNSLSGLLPKSDYNPVKIVSSISSAGRTLAERSYDFVIINSPLPDENGIRLAMDTTAFKNSVVLILVRTEVYGETLDKVTEYGVFALPKPTSKQILRRALTWLASARERIRIQERETNTLEDKINEIRVVNRAKLLLVSELNMDEAQAHRYIIKQAMDKCVARRKVAEEIIKMYS